MRIIKTLNNDSVLVDGKPYGKHYLLVEYSHFIPNTDKKDFTPAFKNCFSLINKYDSFDKVFECEDFNKISIDGLFFNSSDELLKAFSALISSTTPVPPPPPSAPKIIQSIPMQDALGVLVWKNILDDGTFTYTLQNGTAYAGATNTLVLPTALLLATDNYSFQLPAGDYTKAQVLAQAVTLGYTLGKTKIHQVQFVANNGGFVLKNTAGAVQMTADDFTNTDHLIKGNSIGTQLEEVDDFKVTITGNVLTNLIIF